MIKEDYMRLPKERLAELLAERDEQDRNRTIIPYQLTLGGQYNPPCYALDGICVNPQRDCINCPKSWSDGSNLTTAGGFFDEKGTFITDSKEHQPSLIE